jgi:hypothetical protein
MRLIRLSIAFALTVPASLPAQPHDAEALRATVDSSIGCSPSQGASGRSWTASQPDHDVVWIDGVFVTAPVSGR